MGDKLNKNKLLKWLRKDIKTSIQEHGLKVKRDGNDWYIVDESGELTYCHIAYGHQTVIEKIKEGAFDA